MQKKNNDSRVEENGILILSPFTSGAHVSMDTTETIVQVPDSTMKPTPEQDIQKPSIQPSSDSSDPKARNPSKKLGHLDGLRGWASLCVFMGHVGSRICPSIFWTPVAPYYSTATVLSHIFMGMGGFPIVIFFMLSGRVLALSFIKKKDFSKLASAAIRRPFRLVFPVYIALLFYVFFQAGNTFNPNIANANVYVNATAGPVYEWFPLLTDANRVQNVSQFLAEPISLYIAPYKVPANPGLSVYWTLPIEFIFSYIVFVMAMASSAISHQKWLFYLVIIIFDWLNSLNSWLSPFAVGLWIAEVAQTGFYQRIEKGVKGHIVRFLLFAVGITAVLVDAFRTADTENWFSSWTFDASGVISPHPKPDFDQMLPLTLLAGTCLMLLLETSSVMRFIFGNPIMEFFGRISFGVYLLHPTLVVSLGSFLIAKYYDPAAGYSQNSAIAIVFITLLSAIIPLSWIFYHVADKPSIWIGRKVESLVFATEWSLASFMKSVRASVQGIPALPRRGVDYVRYHAAETRVYLSRPSKQAHVAVFGVLGLIDLVVLITFCTMKTETTSTTSPTLSGSSISFKSLNNPAWKGWNGVQTLVTMGDSWTDTSFNISTPPTPSNPIGALPLYNTTNYWGVSGTDGPNWVWGLTGAYNQSRILTWNFASAGAIIDSALITPFRDTVMDMKAQTTSILSVFSGASAAERDSTLIAIMLGGNDVGNTYTPLLYAPYTAKPSVIVKGANYSLDLLYAELVSVYFTQLQKLQSAGFHNFLLINAPPLDRSPNSIEQGMYTSGGTAAYTSGITTFNKLFLTAARNFTAGCVGCTVFHYDMNTYLTYLMTPRVASTFNVTVTGPSYCNEYIGLLDKPYMNSPNCSAPVNQYFWLNTVHPTWSVMMQMAKDMASYMVL